MEKVTYYTIMTAEVRTDNRLTFLARILHGDIVALAGKTGECWATNTYFAEEYQRDTSRITAAIKELCTYGYVRVEYRKPGNNGRVLIPLRENTIPLCENATGDSENTERPYVKTQQTLCENTTHNIINNNKKNNIPPISPTGECETETKFDTSESLTVKTADGTGKKPVDHSKTLLEQRFDTFWAVYPRKTAKQNARKAWAKLKPDDALLSAMLSALKWQTQSDNWKRDGGQYIPHPASWLNAGRWEDEKPNSTPPKKPTAQMKSRIVNGKMEVDYIDN